ncbi:unnamed protein product [Adineta steineri]|nr:unnamed protein product [Adineta steineri]CAF3993752.1 unnamed protein product [Adineta steineri]CAF4257430.1 unnamed protein product [Adineta steineri]
MKVGEVFLPDDQDFKHFKNECTSDDGWTVCYDKSACRVATKKNTLSAFDVVRVQSEFNDISAELLYDVLHDSEYRSTWDTAMLEGSDICTVQPNSDIGYYSIKSPPPFKNRDFVTQRCWLDFGRNKEKYIINHSVNHLSHPPKKNFVRGISYLTGFLMVPKNEKSCTFYYMTQCDPGGSLPAWVVNKTSKVLVPKLMKKLMKACGKYEKWKGKHQPQYKPWLYPEQMTAPRINYADIGTFSAEETLIASGDTNEGAIGENAVEIDKFVGDE